MNSEDLKKIYDNRLKNIEMAMKHPVFSEYYPAVWREVKKINEVLKAHSCSHEWKKYEGFTEVYNYCTKCDVKENA